MELFIGEKGYFFCSNMSQTGKILRSRMLFLDVESGQIPSVRDFGRVALPHLEE